MIDLDGCSLTLEDVVAAAEGFERVQLYVGERAGETGSDE